LRHTHHSTHKSESPYVLVAERAIPQIHITFKIYSTSPHSSQPITLLREGEQR
jgi:hypothetical protein